MKTACITAVLALAFGASPLCAQAAGDYPADYAKTIAAARQEGKVVVYREHSTKAAQPLVRDFRALYPGIEVDYDGDAGSSEMVERFNAEVTTGRPSADVLWSSAMDLQMKLVEDGHAMRYRSPEAPRLPAWAVYRDQAYGTTYEPVVVVDNKQQVGADEVPQDRASFARLVSTRADKFRGKVTAFDIDKSGVGFMFAAQDLRLQPAGTRELLKTFGAADYRPSPGTGEMLEKVASGEYLLGYNIMGAYALVRAKKDLPNLGVVLPRDYTLVLSRVAFINRDAPHPNAARLWLDYLLSKRGQKVLADALELYAIRDDVDAEHTAASLAKQLAGHARPIPIGPEITQDLQPARHGQVIATWKSAADAARP
jgi:iron(III) transport system substrate-binding protein